MEKAYKLESDWFSMRIPVFQEHLSKYKDLQCNFLEIGSYEGRSAIWMLENVLTHPASTLTCIDAWSLFDIDKNADLYRNFLDNIELSGFKDKVTVYAVKSGIVLRGVLRPQFSKSKRKQYDFIYIDGDHELPSPLEDAILSFPLLKVGGLLAFDDYSLDGIPACVDAFLICYQPYITLVHKDWQVWLEKIKEKD